SLAKHIKEGHLFFAFKSLGDAKGFMFYAANRDGNLSAILGDSVRLDQAESFHAVSPLPGQFRLIQDGTTIDVSSADQYEYTWSGQPKKGAYRVEVHIQLNGEDVPWIYTNPIYVY